MLTFVLVTFGIGIVLMAAYIFYLNKQSKSLPQTEETEKTVVAKPKHNVSEPVEEQHKKPSYAENLTKGKRFKKVKTIQKGDKAKPKAENPAPETQPEDKAPEA